MALIPGIIPTQAFETIRDAIASILYTEIRNQETLSGNTYIQEDSYYSERFLKPDETEFPLLNIQFAGGGYGNKDMTRVDGSYVYYIAVYTSSKSDANDGGDKKATHKLHRVLGLIRAILENPIYYNLAFIQPVVLESLVSNIRIPKNDEFTDAAYSIMGYVEYTVRVNEFVNLLEPIPLASSITQVKLYLTDKGYRYGAEGELSFLEAENSTNDEPIYLIGE